MTRQRSKRLATGSVVPALARAATFLGCLLSTHTTPAAAQVSNAVPPSRSSLSAAPPWSGVSGGSPRPLTRARVTPPPVRHRAIHAIHAENPSLTRLFPRAHEVLETKTARKAAMRRHPAGKAARIDAAVPHPSGTARPGTESGAPAHVDKTNRSQTPDCVKTARVRPGDSLWVIAASLPAPAGDTRKLTGQIYELNRETIGSDPDLIFPGQRLVLPEDCER